MEFWRIASARDGFLMECIGETAFWRIASARDGFLMECIGEKALLECVCEEQLFVGVRRRGTAFWWSVLARDNFVGVCRRDGFDGVHRRDGFVGVH